MEDDKWHEVQEKPMWPFVVQMTDVYLCALGHQDYTPKVKASAQSLVDKGRKEIFIQCLANGNTEFPEEVAAEAKTHYMAAVNKGEILCA